MPISIEPVLSSRLLTNASLILNASIACHSGFSVHNRERRQPLLQGAGNIQKDAVVVETEFGQIVGKVGEVVAEPDLQMISQIA